MRKTQSRRHISEHIESFRTFARGTNIKAWMLKILVNVIRDAIIRRTKQVPTTEIDDELESVESLRSMSASLDDPQEIYQRDAFDPELLRALHSLPANLLQPLLLREIDDMSYTEIAETLGLPQGTVMSRLFRARQVLRLELKKTEGVNEGDNTGRSAPQGGNDTPRENTNVEVGK